MTVSNIRFSNVNKLGGFEVADCIFDFNNNTYSTKVSINSLGQLGNTEIKDTKSKQTMEFDFDTETDIQKELEISWNNK